MRISFLLLVALVAVTHGQNLVLDRTGMSFSFDGIGGLSGGGATSRLLVDYVEPQRTEVLDYLFTPNFGASLQILKVEIGGDSQSTDGTETSHMHSEDDLDYQRGYEWWLMVEAKKRNPDILLYGLAWAFPGWVGQGSGSPFTYPNLTATYITNWVRGAKTVYGLDIDFIGVWNERASDGTYVKTLRAMLDSAGFSHTQIVAQDGGTEICGAMAKDPEYAKAVSIIGLHYPSDFNDYSQCHSFGKPVWASEESSSYDDLNGAACWARVITSHWVLSQFTASIMWNLVGSYFHGTEWYASSMLTAVEPWSGHYDVMPVVWASAHVTQFTKVGWRYLKDGSGSGQLPKGGYYATVVDPASGAFTLTVVKIDHLHAACTRPSLPYFAVQSETVTFELAANMGSIPTLSVWYSNFENYTSDAPIFVRQPDIQLEGTTRTFTVAIPVGSFITISTILSGPQKGAHAPPPPSRPQFPLPYSDNFNKYPESQEAAYFSDQIGAFEIHADAAAPGNKVMKQMVPSLPIGWTDKGSLGPVTVMGMREWQDITVQIAFRVPAGLPSGVAGCVATRSDQMWSNGIVFCIYTGTNAWTLSLDGPLESTGQPLNLVAHGTLSAPVSEGAWHTIALTTINATAAFTVNGTVVQSGVAIRNLDTGFAAFGTNGWHAVEFDNVVIGPAGSSWNPTDPCPAASKGAALKARACATNAAAIASQTFDLEADYTLRHSESGLCAYSDGTGGGDVVLDSCDQPLANVQFVNDYTRVRNTPVGFTLQANPSLKLTGSLDGSVTAASRTGSKAWNSWVYFPNTRQLRNQYVANNNLGYPMCLSTC